eukprot:GILK01005797.1.p1 GENE.GILK01005797.1~~GILK01005797.1.p1  ORF type:complete len:542 (-),score=78.94 GILK01005797.1:67-1692(-)
MSSLSLPMDVEFTASVGAQWKEATMERFRVLETLDGTDADEVYDEVDNGVAAKFQRTLRVEDIPAYVNSIPSPLSSSYDSLRISTSLESPFASFQHFALEPREITPEVIAADGENAEDEDLLTGSNNNPVPAMPLSLPLLGQWQVPPSGSTAGHTSRLSKGPNRPVLARLPSDTSVRSEGFTPKTPSKNLTLLEKRLTPRTPGSEIGSPHEQRLKRKMEEIARESTLQQLGEISPRCSPQSISTNKIFTFDNIQNQNINDMNRPSFPRNDLRIVSPLSIVGSTTSTPLRRALYSTSPRPGEGVSVVMSPSDTDGRQRKAQKLQRQAMELAFERGMDNVLIDTAPSHQTSVAIIREVMCNVPEQIRTYSQLCSKENLKPNSKVMTRLKGYAHDNLDNRDISCEIEEYDFSGAYIGNRGIGPLLEALKCNKYFTTLILRDNGLRNEGIQMLVEKLSQHSPLTSIDISNNPISFEAGKALLRLLEINRNIVSLNYSKTYLDSSSMSLAYLSVRYEPTQWDVLRKDIERQLERNRQLRQPPSPVS